MSEDTSRAGGSATEMGLTLERLIRRGSARADRERDQVEVRELLVEYGNVRTLFGRGSWRNGTRRRVRILTAVGPVEVRVPKVRDRSGLG